MRKFAIWCAYLLAGLVILFLSFSYPVYRFFNPSKVDQTDGQSHIEFMVESGFVLASQCTTIHWLVEGPPTAKITLDTVTEANSGSKEICASPSTAYMVPSLKVVLPDGVHTYDID